MACYFIFVYLFRLLSVLLGSLFGACFVLLAGTLFLLASFPIGFYSIRSKIHFLYLFCDLTFHNFGFNFVKTFRVHGSN